MVFYQGSPDRTGGRRGPSGADWFEPWPGAGQTISWTDGCRSLFPPRVTPSHISVKASALTLPSPNTGQVLDPSHRSRPYGPPRTKPCHINPLQAGLCWRTRPVTQSPARPEASPAQPPNEVLLFPASLQCFVQACRKSANTTQSFLVQQDLYMRIKFIRIYTHPRYCHWIFIENTTTEAHLADRKKWWLFQPCWGYEGWGLKSEVEGWGPKTRSA